MEPMLTPEVESALAACGRDRVFHNDGQPPSVAIRWTYSAGPSGHEAVWVVGKAEGSAEGHDSAGRKAAAAFAAKLRERGEALISWSKQIERALGGTGKASKTPGSGT